MAKQILECHRCHRRRSADKMSARIVDAQLVIRCLAASSCASLAKAARRAARDGLAPDAAVATQVIDPVSFASGQQAARTDVAAFARAMAEEPTEGLDRTTWRAALLAVAARAEDPDPEPLTRDNGTWAASGGGR